MFFSFHIILQEKPFFNVINFFVIVIYSYLSKASASPDVFPRQTMQRLHLILVVCIWYLYAVTHTRNVRLRLEHAPKCQQPVFKSPNRIFKRHRMYNVFFSSSLLSREDYFTVQSTYLRYEKKAKIIESVGGCPRWGILLLFVRPSASCTFVFVRSATTPEQWPTVCSHTHRQSKHK